MNVNKGESIQPLLNHCLFFCGIFDGLGLGKDKRVIEIGNVIFIFSCIYFVILTLNACSIMAHNNI
jgi:hypothetical protein